MFILIVILIICLLPTLPPVYAEEQYYARILSEQVYLYSQPVLGNSNIMFELPKSYFVRLIDKAENDYYLVEYNGIKGYVKKDSVRATSTTPSNPYLTNVSFRVYADPSRDMRSYPAIDNSLSERVTYIPLYSKNIEYIAKTKGQELIPNRTNIWYYCKYTTDREYYGYVYSDFCDEMSPIYENTEQVEYIENPTFETPKTESIDTSLDKKTIGIIIAILTLPAIIFVILLLKGKHVLNYHANKHEIIDY